MKSQVAFQLDSSFKYMDITKLLENKTKDRNHDIKLNSPKAIIITYKDCMHLSQNLLKQKQTFLL